MKWLPVVRHSDSGDWRGQIFGYRRNPVTGDGASGGEFSDQRFSLETVSSPLLSRTIWTQPIPSIYPVPDKGVRRFEFMQFGGESARAVSKIPSLRICSDYVEIRAPSSRARFRHPKGETNIERCAVTSRLLLSNVLDISTMSPVRIVVSGSFHAQSMTPSNPTETPPRRTH